MAKKGGSCLRFLVVALACFNPAYAQKVTWEDILLTQKAEFQSETIPAISDLRIKAIPVIESGEALVDLRDSKINPPGSKILLMPSGTNTDEIVFHAPHEKFAHVRQGLFLALKKMVQILPKNVGIYIYEAYRPLSVQRAYFKTVYDRIHAENPTLTHEEVYRQTAVLVAPLEDNIPPHSTGGAIDMTLIDLETHLPLALGKLGAVNGHNPVARTFCTKGLSKEEMDNRKLLYTSAAQAGLVNYPEEWWHFSIGDRYSAYYLGEERSIYGSL